jgi:hypothetical protein
MKTLDYCVIFVVSIARSIMIDLYNIIQGYIQLYYVHARCCPDQVNRVYFKSKIIIASCVLCDNLHVCQSYLMQNLSQLKRELIVNGRRKRFDTC